MILNRIGTAIRKQDWFVVILEVFIVVFGVFIGLQVDDWNQERQERKQEKIILERLLEEAENSVAYMDRFIKNRGDRNLILEQVVAFISDPEKYPMDEDRASANIMRLNHFPAMTPARTVLDELSTSGNLQIIRSSKVRDAIGLYVADLNFHDSQLDQFRNGSRVNSNAPEAYITARYAPDETTKRVNIVDWERLRADPKVLFYAADSLRNQLIFQRYREEVLEKAQLMCNTIAEELGRDCNPILAIDRVEGAQ